MVRPQRVVRGEAEVGAEESDESRDAEQDPAQSLRRRNSRRAQASLTDTRQLHKPDRTGPERCSRPERLAFVAALRQVARGDGAESLTLDQIHLVERIPLHTLCWRVTIACSPTVPLRARREALRTFRMGSLPTSIS